MFWRRVNCFICIFVAVVTVTNCSDPDSVTGSVLEVTVNHSRTDNPDSSILEPVQNVEETMAIDLGGLLDAGDDAMVTLVAGDTHLVAHRAVLAARSPVFAAVFQGDTVEAGSSGQVVVPDVEGPVLRQLLAHVYSLQVPQLPSMAPQLLAAADRYGLPILKADCERQLEAQLTVENAAAAVVLAVKHSSTSLWQAAVAFIRARIFRVMATQGWANAVHSQPKVLKEVIQQLSKLPAETSTMSTDGSSVTPSTQPRRNSSQHVRTTLTAAPPMAHCPDDGVESLLWNHSLEGKARRLIEAAQSGVVEDLQQLLTTGVDVGVTESDGNGVTALHWAAAKGHVEAVRYLLIAGADMEAMDWENYTALHWAASTGQLEVVRCLLEAGANLNARGSRQSTPLHWAAQRGHADVVRLLTAASADLGARTVGGWTPLHDATANGWADAVVALLEAGANRSASDDWGNTPLDFARIYNREQILNILRSS